MFGIRKNKIEFYCLKCNKAFLQNVGKVYFGEDEDLPKFEKSIKCPTCASEYTGKKTDFSDYFELTELGQTQLTTIFFKN